MEVWDKTCADCDWNAVCTHKKILWDGKEYQYVTAYCRAQNGRFYIPSSLPAEPQDWYLWFTIDKRIKIYGREQLVYPVEESDRLGLDNPCPTVPRASKVLPGVVDIPQRNTVARPLVGLKSVYQDSAESTQGSLF